MPNIFPKLQENLPVPAAYKRESQRKSDMNAYDVILL